MIIGSILKAFYSYWVVIANENKNVIFLLIRIKFWNQIIGFAAYIWLTNLVDMFIIVFFIFHILFWDKRIRLNSFHRNAMTAYFDQLSRWRTFGKWRRIIHNVLQKCLSFFIDIYFDITYHGYLYSYYFDIYIKDF